MLPLWCFLTRPHRGIHRKQRTHTSHTDLSWLAMVCDAQTLAAHLLWHTVPWPGFGKPRPGPLAPVVVLALHPHPHLWWPRDRWGFHAEKHCRSSEPGEWGGRGLRGPPRGRLRLCLGTCSWSVQGIALHVGLPSSKVGIPAPHPGSDRDSRLSEQSLCPADPGQDPGPAAPALRSHSVTSANGPRMLRLSVVPGV